MSKDMKNDITKREYKELALDAINTAGNAVANYIISRTENDMPKRIEKLTLMHNTIVDLSNLLK